MALPHRDEHLPTYGEGGIIRGPRDAKRLAIVFTAHSFDEGGSIILDSLAANHAMASFFVTGDYLADPKHRSLLKRILDEEILG